MAEPVVEQADLERAGDPEEESAESRDTSSAVTEVRCACAYCGNPMVRYKLPRFSRGLGIGLLVVGILSSFFTLFVGLPLVAIGAYMGVASRAVWVCPACNVVVDRNDH
jgi:hypothetical protein